MQSMRELSLENGGGLMGLAKGMLGRLEEQHVITYGDRERLMAVLTHLRESSGRSSDQDATFSQLQALHEAIVNEPTSSPLALATSAIALDSVAHALTDDSRHTLLDAFEAGKADAVGALVGGFSGPLTSLATGYTASDIVYETHVDVTVTFG